MVLEDTKTHTSDKAVSSVHFKIESRGFRWPDIFMTIGLSIGVRSFIRQPHGLCAQRKIQYYMTYVHLLLSFFSHMLIRSLMRQRRRV